MADHTDITADSLPEGEFAIVEVLGHRTMVGRVAEVERFGTKMLQVEAFFGPVMLAPVLLGGGSIYQYTPCSAATAWARRPTRSYQLPASLLATVPPAALTSSDEPTLLVFPNDDEEDELGEGEEYGRGEDNAA